MGIHMDFTGKTHVNNVSDLMIGAITISLQSAFYYRYYYIYYSLQTIVGGGTSS